MATIAAALLALRPLKARRSTYIHLHTYMHTYTYCAIEGIFQELQLRLKPLLHRSAIASISAVLLFYSFLISLYFSCFFFCKINALLYNLYIFNFFNGIKFVLTILLFISFFSLPWLEIINLRQSRSYVRI